VQARRTTDAKKERLAERDVLALVKDVDEIWASKGTKVVHLDLARNAPSRAELLGVLLGPSGNLRAPTLRRGRTLIVGFDEATYAKLFS
jgi:hypothetical protein